MLKIIIFVFFYLCLGKIANSVENAERFSREVVEIQVRQWSHEIGQELLKLSTTMTRKENITKAFKPLMNQIYRDDGMILIEKIAREVRNTMDNKVLAVRKECEWWCNQKDLNSPIFPKEKVAKLFEARSVKDVVTDCDCDNIEPTWNVYSNETYNWLPLESDPQYDQPINTNLSVVKVYANIYEHSTKVLEGIRWSEALDLIFKQNRLDDPTLLKYQYFASPEGYMRHYPAVQWSQEAYDVTYDPRTRSWYTEAMTSPKDMIILLDRSGSMFGRKRVLSAHIVNNILDLLNDNDFVNIYTFTNTTEPLVPCFADTLVQANEENLRLLRESLSVYAIDFAADISLGFRKAFKLLEEFRNLRKGSQCNQAIMLITEGLDYDYHPEMFTELNDKQPVRIFTYNLEANPNDGIQMEWIACNNRGYYVNVSHLQETRDKVLNYMNVMSRPINLSRVAQTEIWSYLYIDLADRRYSNWLWRKFEGNRQREIFLDHAKREFIKLEQFLTSPNHNLLQEEHSYEQYRKRKEFDYMTTVSVPVYGVKGAEEVDLLGVAGVDVPIKLLNSLIPHHKIGVNGYAFILTNNGYVLMHPYHRKEFENIPKPTFNRVDFAEVEIIDDSNEPRIFHKSIVELRDKIVSGAAGEGTLRIKFAVDDMKRIILSKRRYYFTKVGPFSLGIALPDNYGLMIVNHNVTRRHNGSANLLSLKSNDWSAHPDWTYIDDKSASTSQESAIRAFFHQPKHQTKLKPLLNLFFFDARATADFGGKINGEEKYVRKYYVDNVFVATHSGLTRWRRFESNFSSDDGEKGFVKIKPFRGTRTIDEDWYKRVVEYNFHRDKTSFVYSVPFEISGYENNTMITSTHAVFVDDESGKTPIAAVGMQFNHRAMYYIYNKITTKCHDGTTATNCPYTCESEYLQCFILDNNAYVILSDEIEHTGRFIGDIRPDIMYHLVKNKVYKQTRMFDYQAICQRLPPEPSDTSGASKAFVLSQLFENMLSATNWALATILMLLQAVSGGPEYQTVRNQETLAYEKLEMKKTFPTPCDQEMWLYTLQESFNSTIYAAETVSKFDCVWPYVVERIPNSNLLFMAMNNMSCKVDATDTYHKSPTPSEIVYNETLPCYIANYNNFTRKTYMTCFNQSEEENELNARNRSYCGHTWK